MTKKYKVTGNYKGKSINETILANSKRQAKLKAGFLSGFGGSKMSSYMKSSKIKVKSV